jgi:hypothetical protein
MMSKSACRVINPLPLQSLPRSIWQNLINATDAADYFALLILNNQSLQFVPFLAIKQKFFPKQRRSTQIILRNNLKRKEFLGACIRQNHRYSDWRGNGFSNRSWKSKLKSVAGETAFIFTWSMLPSGLSANVT